MRTVHASVEVAAPPSIGWARFQGTAGTPRWAPVVEEATETADHVEAGVACRERAAGTIDAAGSRRRRDEWR